MEVNVAIPNFNGKPYLKKLIPKLLTQGFDHIYVLDDASTDGSYKWLKVQPDINTIKGNENLGPAGNRNRILPLLKDGVILFLDADMELISDDIANKVKQHFTTFPNMAVLGALIYSDKDEPMWYNWGYESSPKQDGVAQALNTIALKHFHNESVMETIREAAKGWVGHFEPIEDKEVDWVVEQFFAVRADIFQKMQGFDVNFRRFHEGPDYCKRVKTVGYEVHFVTDIELKHLDMNSGNGTERTQELRNSTRYWYKKHYNVPDEIIERFFLW